MTNDCYGWGIQSPVCCGYSSWQSAVCTTRPMEAGLHYAEFTLLNRGLFASAYIGVVEAGFDAAAGGTWWACESAEGWMLDTGYGNLCHAGLASNWEGMPQFGEVKARDTVGLLLDLGQRTLSVYLNGSRRGVMAAPRMHRMAVGELSGPLRWAVEVSGGASVRIERGLAPPPPSPTEAEVAAAVAWNAARRRTHVSIVSTEYSRYDCAMRGMS